MARALENRCFVAQSVTAGLAPWSPALDTNTGEAAIYAPMDVGLPADGIYPRGQRMLYAGYSGVPERDLAAGFPAHFVRSVMNHRLFQRYPGLGQPLGRQLQDFHATPPSTVQTTTNTSLQRSASAHRTSGPGPARSQYTVFP